ANGEKLCYKQEEIELTGWTNECRINAENTIKEFRPSPGKEDMYLAPGRLGVRVDSAGYSSYCIPPYDDTRITKLIAYGRTREEEIKRVKRALDEFVVKGIDITIPFHSLIMDNEVFKKGDFNTNFLEENPIIEPVKE